MEELTGKTHAAPEESSFSLTDLWNMIWGYKWFYVISTVVCLCIAALYLYVTPKSYVRVAKLIINEDAQANVMSDLISMTGGSGAGSYSSNANNEAEAFASPDLMEKVVERLSLETSYTEDQGIRKVSMYKTSPVEMTRVDTLVKTSFSFRIRKTGEDSFELVDFTVGPEKLKKAEAAGVIGRDVETPVGVVRIDAAMNFGEWDRDIIVFWASPAAWAKVYASNLTVTVTGKNSTVLALSMTDRFATRADRILGTLIDVYNEECKRAADVYYLLDDIPFMSMSTPTLEQGVDYRWTSTNGAMTTPRTSASTG